MKNTTMKYTTILGAFLFSTMPIFANKGYSISHGELSIVKVYNSPVGIESRDIGTECRISLNLSPATESSVKPGKTLRIKVDEGKDIIILCNGKKGITISRD